MLTKRRNYFKFTITYIILTFFICQLLIPIQALAAVSNVRVVLNGQNLDFDVPPVIESGRTLVPFRKIGEAMGAQVNWDQETKTINASKAGKTIILKLGDFTAYIDGSPIKLDMPPIMRKDRTLMPLRFFSEAFGAQVSWKNETRTVMINTGEKISKYILGYYYSQSYEDFLNNKDKMSSVAVKWYTLDTNGDVTDNDSSRYIGVPQGYESVTENAKAAGVETHMLVFEAEAAKLEKILATSSSRMSVVNQIINFVEKESYDGVNIDFEYVKATDKDRFSDFIKTLYEALKSRGKSLNLSLPVKTEKADWWPGYDYEALGKYSDFVVLMAYDKNPATPGPQSGIDWVEEVVDYAIARIPAEKVVLGLGYYGYDWANTGKRGAIIPERNGATYLVFADELSEEYGLKLSIDEKSGLSYGKYIDGNGVSHEVWMENNKTIDAKAKLVLNKGLKGVALWRLGFTTPSFWDALLNNFNPLKY